MRLRLLTFAGAVALALSVPSAALARHGHHHGRHHHSARAHHAKFHFEHIGPSGLSGQTTTPSTPTTPTTPTPTTAPENAGTVTSYEKEVLTITLNDKTTASGKVTADTRIVCVPATTTPMTTEPGAGDKSPGDDSGEGDDQSRGDMSQSGGGWGDDQGDQGDDDGGSGPATAPEPPCDTSLLVSGTLVRAGELRIGPSGAEWEFLVLVR
jgi:hypothetical protein